MKYRIYLDNCCFNRHYDDQSQPRVSFETRMNVEKRIFSQMGIEEISRAAAEYCKENP